MKKIIKCAAILGMAVVLLSGCDTKKEEKTEITVFAAASLTETLTELGDLYMADHSDVNVVFTFDSSGTLKTQIEEGAVCDIFLSAGQLQMDQLENIDGMNFVLEGSRFDILENKVALVVPGENKAELTSFDDFAKKIKEGSIVMAMGNGDVPVGQYTQKILAYYGISEEDLEQLGCITYGTNVKEVTTQVSEAVVDCGVVYSTDAYSARLKVVDVANAQMCGQVIYPAAVMKQSACQEEAKEFLDYLRGKEAAEIFESVGFSMIQ